MDGVLPRHTQPGTAPGTLAGRVMTETLRGGAPAPAATSKTLRAAVDAGGVRTVLVYQVIGDTKYFDVAGTIGRTLGLDRPR